jgi:hypothetical protein
MSITSRFIKEFRPDSVEHVTWLGHMIDVAETMNADKPGDIIAETNKNPMKIKIEARDALDWPHIHFCLFGVYAKAVLKGKAYVPSSLKSSSSLST